MFAGLDFMSHTGLSTLVSPAELTRQPLTLLLRICYILYSSPQSDRCVITALNSVVYCSQHCSLHPPAGCLSSLDAAIIR